MTWHGSPRHIPLCRSASLSSSSTTSPWCRQISPIPSAGLIGFQCSDSNVLVCSRSLLTSVVVVVVPEVGRYFSDDDAPPSSPAPLPPAPGRLQQHRLSTSSTASSGVYSGGSCASTHSFSDSVNHSLTSDCDTYSSPIARTLAKS